MDKKPKTPKAPSLRKVARVYKKTTKQASKSDSGGAHFFTDQARPTGLARTSRTPNFTPKVKSVTVGGTRASKPTTVRKKGRA
jgi:hypothetical protein